jgi:hypothetical protein
MGICLLCIVPSLAWSQAIESKPKVIVLVDSGDESLYQRLRQEMESLGLEVTDVNAVIGEADVNLDAQAKRLGAIAVVRVSGTGGGTVEMTIIDRATGKTVRRQLVSANSTDPAAYELIAIRTIELLRASLMELKSPHPSRGDVTVTKQIEALAYVPEKPTPVTPQSSSPEKTSGGLAHSVIVYGGPALVLANGWSEGIGFCVGGTTTLWGPIRLQGDIVVPLVSMQHRGTAGKVLFDATQLRVGGTYDWFYPAFDWGLSTGGTVSFLSFSGQAVAPYEAAHVDLSAYGGYVGGHFALRLYRRLRLSLGQTVTYLFPNTVVRFAGARVTSFGQPIGTTTLALELGLP